MEEMKKMKPSLYLEKFKKLANEQSDAFTLIGDFILVERIPDEEIKRKSGLIIPDMTKRTALNTLTGDKPNWVRVLLVGPGYYSQDTDENGNITERTVPLDVKPGDIALVSQVSVRYFSTFAIDGYEADTIGLTKESEIQLRFHGEDGYNRVFNCLNGSGEARAEVAGQLQ